MTFLTLALVIVEQFLYPSSSHYFITFLALRKNFLLLSTFRQTAKQNNKIA